MVGSFVLFVSFVDKFLFPLSRERAALWPRENLPFRPAAQAPRVAKNQGETPC